MLYPHFIGVKVSGKELATLRALAEQHKVSMSEVLRRGLQREAEATLVVDWPVAPAEPGEELQLEASARAVRSILARAA